MDTGTQGDEGEAALDSKALSRAASVINKVGQSNVCAFCTARALPVILISMWSPRAGHSWSAAGALCMEGTHLILATRAGKAFSTYIVLRVGICHKD